MSIIEKLKEAVTRKKTLPINDVFVMVTNGVDENLFEYSNKALYDVIVKVKDKYYTLKGKEIVLDQKQISPLYRDLREWGDVNKGCKEFVMSKSLSTIVDRNIEQERLDKMGEAFTPECKVSHTGLKLSKKNHQGKEIDCNVDILVLKPSDKDSEIRVSIEYLRMLEQANHHIVTQRIAYEESLATHDNY